MFQSAAAENGSLHVTGSAPHTADRIQLNHGDQLAHGNALVRDRGSQFVAAFDEIFRTEGLKVLETPVRTPVANTFAERWIGSIRRDIPRDTIELLTRQRI